MAILRADWAKDEMSCHDKKKDAVVKEAISAFFKSLSHREFSDTEKLRAATVIVNALRAYGLVLTKGR